MGKKNNKVQFEPLCLATGIGGMPHTDIQRACRLILETMAEIPHLPMLPMITLKSGSPIRFLEGMPCLVKVKQGTQCYIDTANIERVLKEMEAFYNRYFSQDIDYFAISQDYAPDIHIMLDYIQTHPSQDWIMINCGIRGPITLGLQVFDENRKPIFYNEMFRDALSKILYMKIKWIEERLSEAVPGLKVLIMIAEPGLSVHGSAFYVLEKNDIINSLNEVLSAAEGLTMIHCCGNIDWRILMETNASIISFDAYNHSDFFTFNYEALSDYINRNKMIAWGIVPTTKEEFEVETVQSLVARFENTLQILVERGLDRKVLLKRALITPSCSVAGMPVEMSEQAYWSTQKVACILREKYF